MWTQLLRRSRYINAFNAPCTRHNLHVKHQTNEYGIPLQPIWSVHELLSSYPKPTISSQTLTRLHELSALKLPVEGSPEHAKLKQEMEEFVRLVEAVKLVDTQGVHPTSHDGETPKQNDSQQEVSGRELLKHAARISDGFYVVDSDRKRL